MKSKNTHKALKAVQDTTVKTGKLVKGNPMGTVYVIGGLLAVYIAYKAVKGIQHAIDPQIDDSVPGTGGSTIGATISDQQAINFAGQLLDAMNVGRGTWFFSGTDEATISKVFDRLKNGADFIKVYHAFGLKEYDGYESPPDNALIHITAYQKRDLVYWLKKELSPLWDARVYKKVKTTVEQAGFAF